jgi:hypothetical protein
MTDFGRKTPLWSAGQKIVFYLEFVMTMTPHHHHFPFVTGHHPHPIQNCPNTIAIVCIDPQLTPVPTNYNIYIMPCLRYGFLLLTAISLGSESPSVAFESKNHNNHKIPLKRHRRVGISTTTSPSSSSSSSQQLLALHALHPISDFRKWREDRRLHNREESHPISPLLLTQDWKKRQVEMEEWEEEDFLSANIRPKELNHERDFFRVSTRVQAWDEYVIVSILCTSICYTSLSSKDNINPTHVGDFFYETILQTAIQLTAGAAVLFGIYSTMVFSISILYGKTALGLEQDPQFDNFLDSTAEIRKRAFQSFSCSLGLFALMVVLKLAVILPLTVQIPVMIGLGWFLYVFYRDWKVLTTAAEEVFDDE